MNRFQLALTVIGGMLAQSEARENVDVEKIGGRMRGFVVLRPFIFAPIFITQLPLKSSLCVIPA